MRARLTAFQATPSAKANCGRVVALFLRRRLTNLDLAGQDIDHSKLVCVARALLALKSEHVRHTLPRYWSRTAWMLRMSASSRFFSCSVTSFIRPAGGPFQTSSGLMCPSFSDPVLKALDEVFPDRHRVLSLYDATRQKEPGNLFSSITCHPAWTKLSNTILRPALSNSTVSLLPSTVATVPVPNFA